MSRDGERLIETVNELGSRIGHLLSDMVPPAAQVHLLNAQHRVTATPGGRRRAAANGARRAPAQRRPSKRVGKIPID